MRLKRVLSALLCSTLLTLGVVAVNEGTKEKEVMAVSPNVGTFDYNLGEHEDFATWSNSYSKRTLSYDGVEIVFASANKQTSTIIDCPVTKGGDVEFKLTDPDPNVYISSFTFTAKQWSTKAQTITASYSKDVGKNYTTISGTSTNFSISKSNSEMGDSKEINAIKITFSSKDNQVGIYNFNVTFAAKEVIASEKKIITYHNADGYTSTEYDNAEGYTSLPTPKKTNYDFMGWYDNKDNKLETISAGSGDIDIYAKWQPVGVDDFKALETKASLNINYTEEVSSQELWTLIKDVNELNIGDSIIIASNSVALSTTQNSNNRGEAAIEIDGDTIDAIGNSVQVITLEEGTIEDTFSLNVGDGNYLYAASSSKNYLRSQSQKDNNSSWKIEIGNEGVASIIAQGSNTRNNLKYNSSNNIFSCYESGQEAVKIYKPINPTTYAFSQVDLRFGIANSQLTNEIFGELSKHDGVKYGIAACQGVEFDVKNAKSVYCTPAESSHNFALVLTNVNDYSMSISARAFVEINGEKYYATAKTYSVNSLAKDYVDNHSTEDGVKDHLPALKALKSAKFIG